MNNLIIEDADKITEMIEYGASQSDVIDWLGKRDSRREALQGEIVGTLTIEHFRNSPEMQNVEYEHADGILDPGKYKLYIHYNHGE